MKTCLACKVEKPLECFYKNGSAEGRPLRAARCIPCYRSSRKRSERRGRPSVVEQSLLDLLSISCEWWTVDGVAARLGRSRQSVMRHMDRLHEAGQLRRRQRLQTGAYEYQSDPFWIGGAFLSHAFGTVSPDQEGEAA